jgi:hypothetical protein
MRLEDASAAIWEAYPSELLGIAEVVTDVGGPQGSILVLAVVYWLVDRERGATVAAYALVGAGVITSLKFALALPRPPDPAIVADGYGFPSGHAFTAAVVYGSLLLTFDRVRDPRAVATAVTAVGAISLTRVILRVHYLGDILVGAVLGLSVLVAMHEFVDSLRVGFSVAVAAALVAVVVSGGAEPAFVALGTALGAFGASFFLDAVPERRSRAEGVLLVVCGVAYLVLVVALDAVVVGATAGLVAGTLTVLFHAALVVGIFLAPVAVRRLDQSRQAWLSAST